MTNAYDIAVVGMAGAFPGAADLSAFWRHMMAGQNAGAPVKADRWGMDPQRMVQIEPAPDMAYSDVACTLPAVEWCFDGLRVDRAEIKHLDPLHHLVLHVGREAAAGLNIARDQRRRAGVILAAIALPTDAASVLARRLIAGAYTDSLQAAADKQPPRLNRMQCLAARMTGMPALLLSRALGFGGMSYTLDAACASSLVAVKLACDALTAMRTDVMLAGGVSRPDNLYTQVGFSQLRALSPSGRCAPFDASADGLVVGEGAGMLVLKRLPDALKDGDRIYGIVRAVGLANDFGRNLLAPQSEGQVRAMQSAYAAAGWQPGDIEYVECHGAGTPRGDRTEISSMNQLWRAQDRRNGQCPIGSVKSMVGHLLTAAGAAGLIKTLLALQHHMLPPSLNFSAPGPNSPLTGSPFSVVTAPLPWEQRDDGPPRRCAVNAFGFGGINAHLLLESADSLHKPGLPKRAIPSAAATIDASESTSKSGPADETAAVVGMAVAAGPIRSLSAFDRAVLNGTPAAAPRSPELAAALQPLADTYFNGALPEGAYIEALHFRPGDFRLSPREMQATLPQHLLMLQTAHAALRDAGIDLSKPQPRTAVVIGAEFDFNATDHTARWHLHPRPAQISGGKTDVEERLRDALGPPLTADRTLGSLTGVIASRIAKTFQLGGASFVVSCDTLSGPAALDAALHLLRRGEADRVLVGAVDIMGDIRRLIMQHQITPFSNPRPSDATAPVNNGHWPGDGAAALVLERRCDALDQGLDYYADICAVDLTLAADPDAPPADAADRQRAFGRRRQAVETATDGLDFLEIQTPDALESAAPPSSFMDMPRAAAVGAVNTVVGFCGAAAGLMSVVKVCLFLSRGAIPSTTAPQRHRAGAGRGQDRPCRSAAVGALSADGGAACIGLSAPPAGHAKTVSGAPEDGMRPAPTQTTDSIIIPVSAKTPLAAPAAPPRQPAAASAAPGVPLQDELVQAAARGMEQTTGAHQAFLRFTKKISGTYARAFELQNRLLTASIQQNPPPAQEPVSHKENPARQRTVAFSREACLEFAVGRAADVLGPMFAVVDTYPARVRLPDEPLMLVDRILSVEGRKGSLQSGRIVTEHDVHPDAWYLDGGRAPVCIAVEAGQADLFLCAYLGIDLAVKGQRTYRLLDATVTFFGGLPCPGDTLRYEIEIEKFIRQGQTYLFLFHFDGFIGGRRFMQMRHGCAGFFTEKEVRESGGILARDLEQCPARTGRPLEGGFPVPVEKERYDDAALKQLRQGDLAAGFGPAFQGKKLAASLRLPGGRMHLIDRVRELDPKGGRYGNGRIRAEADIRPDDWFLTCHFVDDPVMPGTLMYECCAHTLRVFLQRIGWISDRSDVCYAPVAGAASVLKCRGPVTPKTRKVVYEIDIRELGYNPAPYALADAHMYADGHRIVYFQDMSMQVSGLSQEALADYWGRPGKTIHAKTAAAAAPSLPPAAAADRQQPAKRFNRRHMETFARGLPSAAFGAPYRPFDRDRFIARLPRPPYLFLERISRLEPEAWVLKPDGWIEAQYDVDPQDWYFRAAGIPLMPLCVLNELALQPCGWLAAYMGSALQSQKDLHFRNLDGRADILGDVTPRKALIRMRVRLTGVSAAGGMIIETFDFDIRGPEGPLYQGATRFGFFTHAALAQQKGITTVDENLRAGDADGPSTQAPKDIHGMAALSPAGAVSGARGTRNADIPDLLMIDRIDRYLPRGGPANLGYVKGSRAVRPADWFFKAHFFQDPVCPGSLGLESLMQLLRFLALQHRPDLSHSAGFSHRTGESHRWTYRGQITPQSRRITVEAFVTHMLEKPDPVIFADGLVWVDGLCIYHIQNLGLRVVGR